jgi:hypothetical protein
MLPDVAVNYRGQTVLVHNWLKALPEDLIRTRPLLRAVYASTIVLTSLRSPECIARAEQWLQEAEKALALQSPAGKESETPQRPQTTLLPEPGKLGKTAAISGTRLRPSSSRHRLLIGKGACAKRQRFAD